MTALRPSVDQSLSVALNTQLQQTLHVLSLGMVDLLSLIQDQCERNPFLEKEDPPLSEITENLASTSPWGRNDEETWLQNVSEPPSVRDLLIQQIQTSFHHPESLRIAFFLLDALDDKGYCTADMSLAAWHLSVSHAQVYDVLKTLQTFEPAGVFARTLQESLTLQLVAREAWNPLAEDIIRALGAPDPHHALKQSMKHSPCVENWKKTCSDIQKLTLRPLEEASISQDEALLIPDLQIQVQKEAWDVHVNNAALPHVWADSCSYHHVKAQRTRSAQDQMFMRDHWAQAQSFVQCLKQRQRMLTRVGQAIFQEQETFLGKGKEGLRPLTLQDIAHTLNVHVSTVSRAIHHKFVQTPHGTYPLKFFFKSFASNSQATAPYIQEKIQALIRQERPHKPFSDQDIAHALSQSQMVISRRTVQKYREQMRIPNAALRRRVWIP